MKYILIGASLLLAYIAVTLFVARFCGMNSRLEKDDRNNSN